MKNFLNWVGNNAGTIMAVLAILAVSGCMGCLYLNYK